MSEPLVEAWRRWSDRFMDPKNRDGTPIRDAFAAGWDAARAEPGASEGLRQALTGALSRQPTSREVVDYGMDDPRGGVFNQNQWRLDLIRALAASPVAETRSCHHGCDMCRTLDDLDADDLAAFPSSEGEKP